MICKAADSGPDLTTTILRGLFPRLWHLSWGVGSESDGWSGDLVSGRRPVSNSCCSAYVFDRLLANGECISQDTAHQHDPDQRSRKDCPRQPTFYRLPGKTNRRKS